MNPPAYHYDGAVLNTEPLEASVISLPSFPLDERLTPSRRERPSWLDRIVKQRKQSSDPSIEGILGTGTSPNKVQRRIRRSTRKKKTVRFADENEIFSVSYNKKDVNSRWYSAQERSAFLEREKSLADELKWTESFTATDPTSWSAVHRRVFEAACLGQKADLTIAELGLEAWAPGNFDVSVLGMDKKVISTIANDSAHRRRNICDSVFAAQKTPVRNENMRTNRIREASLSFSRPSTLYARCVAKMAAAL